MRQHWLILFLLPLTVLAQAARKSPTPTGLKLISTTLEPPSALDQGARPVALTVQNVTDKTIVAVAASFQEFRADGVNTYYPPQDAAHGVGMDHDGPSSADLDPAHHDWIRPGQVTQIRLFAIGNPETASVKVTITGLVYEDRTSEGTDAQMFFLQRRDEGRKARGAARQEKSPTKRKMLEKQAEWYESHDAVEAEK